MNPVIQPLALRPKEAAKALGISERTLWGLTAPRGPIAATKIGGKGGCTLYAVCDLQNWLQTSAVRQPQPECNDL
jgi:hypothetical protein